MSIAIKRWSNAASIPIGTRNQWVTFKDDVFDDPERTKKVYGVSMTYKLQPGTSPLFSTMIRVEVDGGTNYLMPSMEGQYLGTTGEWTTTYCKFNTPYECNSFSLQLNQLSTLGKILYFDNVSLEYRSKYKRFG